MLALNNTMDDLQEIKETLSFYILNRMFSKALELAGKLLQNTSDPDILYFMGLAYEGLNKKNEAIEKFREVLTMAPDKKEAYEHLKKLVSN